MFTTILCCDYFVQLKCDAKEPLEKLDCSSVVKNVRFCNLTVYYTI